MFVTNKAPATSKIRLFGLAILEVLIFCAGAPELARGETPALAPQPLSLSAYTQELDRWLVAADRLDSHPEDAPALRQQLPLLWTVSVDGQRFEVSTGWLRAGLEALERDPKALATGTGMLRARLKAMHREAQDLAQVPPRSLPAARQTLDEILSRREFREVHGPTWLERWSERVERWLTALLERLNRRVTGNPTSARMVFWALVLLAAGALLVWMVRRLLQRPGTLPLGLTGAALPRSSWQQMLGEARAAAARAKYREAIRCAYWSAIYRLEESGLWSADRSRTHREYLRLVSPGRPQREPLAALTRQFELAWYAGRACSADDFRSVLAQLERLGCLFPSTRAIERS